MMSYSGGASVGLVKERRSEVWINGERDTCGHSLTSLVLSPVGFLTIILLILTG